MKNLQWVAGMALCFATLSACGGSSEAAAEAAAHGQSPGADEQSSPADHRSITVRYGDDGAIGFEASGKSLARLSGGCDGKSPLSIGFQSGQIYQPSWRYFAFDSADNVGVKQLGDIALNRVVFDNGVLEQSEHGTFPPNRHEGVGTLTISRHEAGTHDKRMEGVVRAQLLGPNGETVPVEAEFSIPLACWSPGFG